MLGFGGGFAAAVAIPLVFDGPAASAGAVGFEVVSAVEFPGGRDVGGGWFAGQEFFQQGRHLRQPGGMMITSGNTGRPNLRLTDCAGTEVLSVKLLEARLGRAQFPGDCPSGKLVVSMADHEVADELGRQAFEQL